MIYQNPKNRVTAENKKKPQNNDFLIIIWLVIYTGWVQKCFLLSVCHLGFHCPLVVGQMHRDSAGEKKYILSQCMWCHHIYEYIWISFGDMVTWNWEAFFYSPSMIFYCIRYRLVALD